MQSEASSQQLSTHSSKVGPEQINNMQVHGSVYDPISAGSSRRSSESSEPLSNGLTSHLHRVHARAQASQHLSNTSNLVVLSQNESLASDSEGLHSNFRRGQITPLQPPVMKIEQPNVNQARPLSALNGKDHHPNQNIVLEQLDQNKPIEENNDLILPDEMVNYLHELAEQNNRPPSVISEAVTSVSRYVPPPAAVNNQQKPVQNNTCTNHSHSQSCSQVMPQNWQSCNSCCQNSHNSCTMHHCTHNNSNYPNGNQQPVQPCCYSNNPAQPPVQNCYNEMQKPMQAHPACSNNNPANIQKVPFNSNTVPYAASIPPANPHATNPIQNNCYQTYPQQQDMNTGYSDIQQFNNTNNMHSNSVASYPQTNYIPNNSQPNNYLSSRPYVGNTSINYESNQQNIFPNQGGMHSHGFNSTANSIHSSCSQTNYSSHNVMNKPLNQSGMVPQNMQYNNQVPQVNHNQIPINPNNQVPLNHNHNNNSNQMSYKQAMNMNQNLQVMRSDCANHLNYSPQNNPSYNANMQQWCNNHSQDYGSYNQTHNPMTYSQEVSPNISQNPNGMMMQHPTQVQPATQSFNTNVPHQSCNMHKMGMNRSYVNNCNYSNQMLSNRTDSAQYQTQQQTPASMQYPVIQPNQYHDPKSCESQMPVVNSNIHPQMNSACQNQLPNLLHSDNNHCCNHKLGTSIQAQHSASSVCEQDEKESSVSAAMARSSHTCSTSDQREIQCQNVSQSSLSGEAYQRTLKYVQQCQELLGQQQASPGYNRVSSSTDRHSPTESHSPLLQTSNMVINDLNSGLHSLVEETRYLQLLH